KLWRAIALATLKPKRLREAFLSWFGPLSLLGLFVFWFVLLILGFGLLMWSIDMPVQTVAGKPDLPTYLYLSGVTFFTLGFGDITPNEPLGRILVVVEAGLGFGFLALLVSYLPVLYQAFSRREASISMLDARAGSPPSAAQVLIRAAEGSQCDALEPFLREWERWSAEVLESHLSYPVLSYYRSQHDNQSWLAALTAVLDTCALLLTGLKERKPFQSQLTFAMARHAIVDLALVFQVPPVAPESDRLPPDKLQKLREKLKKVGLELRSDPAGDERLAELRGMYEPFVNALARHFVLALPPIDPEHVVADNWQTSAWTRRTPGIGKLPVTDPSDEHFD
ncbi:MAG TPA: potassium channel family protein, partial [Gemmataceae bacterium]|nr:potassium channel family protein [Gemmataceae bacterium]